MFKKLMVGALVSAITGVMVLAPTVSSAADNDKVLVFEGFGGAFKKSIETSLIKPFEKKYGVRVQYVVGTSGQLLAKARAAKDRQVMDVIWTSPLTHDLGKAEGLLAKTTPQEVPNINGLYDLAKDPDGVGAAHDLQALGIVYNKEVFEKNGWAAPTSWNDLFDPKFKDHVVAQNMPISYGSAFLVKMSLMNGGTADKLDAGFEAVKKLKDNGTMFVDSPAQVASVFTSGSAWIGYDGSGRVALSQKSGLPLGFVLPKEGAPVIRNYMDVLENAPHPELARKFLNMSLAPEVQSKMAAALLVGPTNKDAKLSDEVAAKVPYGETVEKLDDLDLSYTSLHLNEVTRKWIEMVGTN